MNYLKTTILTIALCLAGELAMAQTIPTLVSYQGRLMDSGGMPVSGSVPATFALWDGETAGTMLWTESKAVEVSNGLYSVLLGDSVAIPASVFAGSTVFLEVTVMGETLAPRERLTAVPYAFRADDADNLGGVAASGYSLVGHTHDFSELTGTATDAQIPDNITISLAQNATDLGGLPADAYVLVAGDTMTGHLAVQGPLDAGADLTVAGDATVVGGNLGLGTTASVFYSILNDPATAPAYGADLSGSLYGMVARWSTDSANNYAYLGGQSTAVNARSGTSANTGSQIGGNFVAYSQGIAYGIGATSYGYGSNAAYAYYGYANNSSNGNAYGGYFLAAPTGSGKHYGIFASGNDYAAWLTGGPVHVGDGGTEDFVDGDGDLFVKDELEAHGNAFVGGDLTVNGGHIGVGTGPSSSNAIRNGASTTASVGADIYGTTSGVEGHLASDPVYTFGILGSTYYGVYGASGDGNDTTYRFGGYFVGNSKGLAYGVAGYGWGYDTGDARGVYGYGANTSTGKSYGGYFQSATSGTGTHYGVYGTSIDYPVYAEYYPFPAYHYAFLASPLYGVYARSGSSSDTSQRWGGYFVAYTQSLATGVSALSYGYGVNSTDGVYAYANNSGGGNAYAVYAYGTASGGGAGYGIYDAAGTKNWVNPDPEDPGKAIAYVTVESGENLTYCRGSAKLVNGHADVVLPDHFRKVTSADYPITVQVTPGSASSLGLAVTFKSNSRIVVDELYQGIGSYSFDYTVQGTRLGYEDYDPVIDNVDYVPFQGNHQNMDESETTTQEWYDQQSNGLKRIFKTNGTLDNNGKVNEATFKARGWKEVKVRAPKPGLPAK